MNAILLALVICGASLPLRAADDYVNGPDSKPQEGVPKGEVTKYTFEGSKIFPGTTREYWVYVPKQYDPAKPACLHVGQDGVQYLAPVVFDNLIHKKEIPVIIGVFVMHGRVKSGSSNALDRFNRSYEYDGLGDNYARFLLEELLPEVEKKTTADGRPIRLSKNPNDRAIAGASSGAICAFTAAWERPDAFRRIFSSIGTYVDQRGGNDYPALIRKVEPKPLRIFLQDGSNDNNGTGGNWFLANQEMLSALEFSGYEVNHVWGDGGHNGKHATAIFPDAMRWLWKDWPKEISRGVNSKQPVMQQVLAEGSEWQLVSEGHGFTEGPAVNAQGEVFFTDIPKGRIHKIGLDGKVSVFAEETGNANGLMFGPDGKLYACANGKKEVRAYDASGKYTVIAEGLPSNDVCISQNGNMYVTDPGNKQVWLMTPKGEKRVVDKGINFPNGVRFSPDQSLLLVADMRGQFVWSFHIDADGSLSAKQAYHHLRIPDGATETSADGMTLDTDGRLYVTTAMGIQFCDQAGRVNGIISKPQNKWIANVVFGGANFDELFVCASDKMYKRKTKVKGVISWQAPIKPAAPRL